MTVAAKENTEKKLSSKKLTCDAVILIFDNQGSSYDVKNINKTTAAAAAKYASNLHWLVCMQFEMAIFDKNNEPKEELYSKLGTHARDFLLSYCKTTFNHDTGPYRVRVYGDENKSVAKVEKSENAAIIGKSSPFFKTIRLIPCDPIGRPLCYIRKTYVDLTIVPACWRDFLDEYSQKMVQKILNASANEALEPALASTMTIQL